MRFLQYWYAKIKSKLNKDMTILAVDIANKNTMIFKNGSVIECSKIENSDTVRGKRSKLPLYFDDFDYDEEKLEKILGKVINNKVFKS